MAFDRTNPADLQALQTEVNTDPIGMGYVPSSTKSGVLDPINTPADNVGGETTGADLTQRLLMDAILAAPTEFSPGGQFSDGEHSAIVAVVTMNLEEFGETQGIEEWRARIRTALTGAPGIIAALDAQSRALSRAEVLFGEGTTISQQDWFSARDYIP